MYIPAKVELPKVKASELYPSNKSPRPSGLNKDNTEYAAVERISSKINLSCFILSATIRNIILINIPKLSKYHKPEVLVETDQKDISGFNPKTPDIIKEIKYNISTTTTGDLEITRLEPFLKSDNEMAIPMIVVSNINAIDLVDVPPYAK